MKIIPVAMLCAALLAVSAGTTLAQGYPARMKLTCITTNAGVIVKTIITEKDIIARCASDNSVDPARLRLLLVNAEVDVVDIVSSNVTCAVATTAGHTPTNVTLFAYSGVNSNSLKAVTFTPFRSLGDSLLPADLSGTMVTSFAATYHTNSLVSAKLKGTIQAGSRTNETIYTGTITIGGKPFYLPE